MPVATTRTYRRLFTASLLTLALASLAPLGGCWAPGGRGISDDSYTYWSTTNMPQTVTITDLRTGQAIFSIDIPVGKQFVCKFYTDDGDENDVYPDLMKWDVWPLASFDFGLPEQRLQVPPSHARRIDTTLRTTPEVPLQVKPIPSGAAPTGDPSPEGQFNPDGSPMNRPPSSDWPPRQLPAVEDAPTIRTEPGKTVGTGDGG